MSFTPIHTCIITTKAGDRKITRRFYFSRAEDRNGFYALARARGHSYVTKGLSVIRHDSEHNLNALCELEEEVKRASIRETSNA